MGHMPKSAYVLTPTPTDKSFLLMLMRNKRYHSFFEGGSFCFLISISGNVCSFCEHDFVLRFTRSLIKVCRYILRQRDFITIYFTS